MVHDEWYEDDIMELWGARDHRAEDPTPSAPASPDSGQPAAGDGLGQGMVDGGPAVQVAAPDAAREAEAVVPTLELASALYGVKAAFEDRIGTLERHIDQRLDDITDRITEALATQAPEGDAGPEDGSHGQRFARGGVQAALPGELERETAGGRPLRASEVIEDSDA